MRAENKYKTLYLRADIHRKAQIHQWVHETINKNGFNFQDTYIELANNNYEKAFYNFKLIIYDVIESDNTLGYILNENISYYGEFPVMQDLYTSLIKSQYRAEIRTPRKTENITPITIKKHLREEKKKFKFRYGYDTEGIKRQATLKPYINKDKIDYKLKDVKTGKFLTNSKRVEKEIKKLKELKIDD